MIYRGHIISNLEGYSAGPQIFKLLETFWYHQELVTRHNRYHGPNFKATWGTTQGGLISTTLSNMVVDNVVQTCLAMTVKYQVVAQEGLGLDVGRCLVVFYADNVMFVTWESDWLHNVLNVIISLFRRYGIVINIAKSRMIACQPGALRSLVSEEAMVR